MNMLDRLKARPGRALAPAAAALALALVASPAPAQTKEVRVALIAPFSGPWARQGDLMLKGAEMAVDDINAQGGIKALGGAKLKLS
jgi:branched-chain amino acid transport system substrate-binding protein